jgi:ubiquitin-protein ligase
MWWVKDPDRLKSEVFAVEALRDDQEWLSVTAPTFSKDLLFAINFDIIVNGETFRFRLQYPTFFPETPPSVIPRDGRQLSGHQYGTGGELCLEYRPDNWDPSATGSMLIESTYRLLSTEAAGTDGLEIVPSDHSVSLGQDLRRWICRFLIPQALMSYISDLPVGTCRDAEIVDMLVPTKKFTAYLRTIGPSASPDWRESLIPDRGDAGAPAILIRVGPSADFSGVFPDQQSLDKFIATARGTDEPPLNFDATKTRFTVVSDGNSVLVLCSWPNNRNSTSVIQYRPVYLKEDTEIRLPGGYESLASRKVGIVGCGALGSKIAASLARSGVRGFVLIDADILKPGNLVRHELDVGSVGAHKAEALATRLKALAAGISVSYRRVILGGQESSGNTASVLEELSTCDLLIDATANPQAFNFVASVARNALRPMIWAEVYAGGIGGFVGRVRPGIEPPPHSARTQYLGWCRNQGVPWHGLDRDYAAHGIGTETLIADDSDVAVIAAHTTRMGIDALVHPDNSAFPHPAYVIGLAREWIFTEPFDTRPIDFVPDGQWTIQPSSERTQEAIDFVLSILKPSADEN